jgi:hypothetical protein
MPRIDSRRKDDQQRAEKEDLGHQRLNHASLVADDQRDHQKEQDGDVEDQDITANANRTSDVTIGRVPYTAANCRSTAHGYPFLAAQPPPYGR